MNKEEEKKGTPFEEFDSFLNKTTKERASFIVSVITAAATIVVSLIDFLPIMNTIGKDKNQILLQLGVVAIAVFAILFLFQFYLIRKKKNDKMEKLKSNLIDKYFNAIDHSFINPKNN